MPSQFLQELGMQAASDTQQGLLGIASGAINDRRQIKQQAKLNKLQREQMDYAQKLQLQMWLDTNYPAQMEQLKKAGLNPGLIYGMSGGGSATTGSQSAGSAANAPSGGGEITAMMGMGIQRQMLQAQKDLLESQTDLNKAEAENKRGVDRTLGETQVKDLLQGISNKQAQETLTRVQTRLTSLQAELQTMTLDDQANYIGWQAMKMQQELMQANNETYISNETLQTKVDLIRQELVNAYLDAAVKKSGIAVNEQQIKNMAQDLINSIREIEIKQGHLDNDTIRVQVAAFAEKIKANYPGLWNVIGRYADKTLRSIVDGIFGRKSDNTEIKIPIEKK